MSEQPLRTISGQFAAAIESLRHAASVEAYDLVVTADAQGDERADHFEDDERYTPRPHQE